MRKLLLAASALVVLGAAPAMALDSETVIVSASVSATCSVSDPNDVSFGTDPVVGATNTSNFSFTCNFAGNSVGTLQVSFQSANGGLANVNDGTDRSYTVKYGANAAVTAASIEVPADIDYPETSGAANVANARSFTVQLAEALPVAGAYSDTLTVSVAP